MNGFRLCLLVFAIGLSVTATAETEIHRCTDADGGIVYSQLPCPAQPAPEEDEKGEEGEAVEASADPLFAEYDAITDDEAAREPRSAEEVAACKQQYRDAIDAIDAEIAREYSAEKSDEYKERLLELTRQLRRC